MYLLLVPQGMSLCNMTSVTALVWRWRSLNQKAGACRLLPGFYGFLVYLPLHANRLDLDNETRHAPCQWRWQAVLQIAS